MHGFLQYYITVAPRRRTGGIMIKETLLNRPQNMEIVMTGRRAHPELVAMAHLVTEMKPIKHYFDQGVMARQGIEY